MTLIQFEEKKLNLNDNNNYNNIANKYQNDNAKELELLSNVENKCNKTNQKIYHTCVMILYRDAKRLTPP